VGSRLASHLRRLRSIQNLSGVTAVAEHSDGRPPNPRRAILAAAFLADARKEKRESVFFDIRPPRRLILLNLSPVTFPSSPNILSARLVGEPELAVTSYNTRRAPERISAADPLRLPPSLSLSLSLSLSPSHPPCDKWTLHSGVTSGQGQMAHTHTHTHTLLRGPGLAFEGQEPVS